MAGNDGVGLQGDIVNAPLAALASAGFAQGLLRAVSADDVNPVAVVQVQAIGSCFQSNGDWAARAPDLLTRTSSARLDRLSAWIGWSKGDTPSFMSQTAGGRTASLLCLALGSLYSKEQCGMILFYVSRDLLPSDSHTSGLSQLGDVCMCLENKLACLGFGNHLAAQLTRLRQCFFEAGQQVPGDLVDTPTEEVMHAFLVNVRDALHKENQTLHFLGSRCAGALIALALAICPEDVRVQVDGEIIARGQRDSIIFSVTNEPQVGSRFYMEQKLQAHTDEFSRNYIVKGRHEHNRQLHFSWDGILSAQLDIVFATVGARPTDHLKPALATLATSAITTFRDTDWLSALSIKYGSPLPPEGLKTLLGPRYQQLCRQRLARVLSLPSESTPDFISQYRALHDIAAVSLPLSSCTCGRCGQDPWKPRQAQRGQQMLCPVAQVWSTLAQIVELAIYCSFVQASPNMSLRAPVYNLAMPYFASFLFERGQAREIDSEWEYGSQISTLHSKVLNLVRRWSWDYVEDSHSERPPSICSSSDSSTVYPTTLEFPEIINPWNIQYNLVDGRLQYGSDRYNFIICASIARGSARKLTRRKALKTILPLGQPVSPSRLGEHSSLLMTLRPAFVENHQALILRCLVTESTGTTELNFAELHLGLMQLSPAEGCEHSLAATFHPSDKHSIKATSVIAPVASGKGAISVTLTQRSGEAQFLCCIQGIRQIYQGDCCIACAVAQAQEKGYSVVIGGSPSTYLLRDESSHGSDQEHHSGSA